MMKHLNTMSDLRFYSILYSVLALATAGAVISLLGV